MIRVLFICARARTRGPTAAQVFADRAGVRTDFAGIAPDADDRVSAEQIDWADVIMAMERRHATLLNDRFRTRLAGKKILVLDIRDRYTFMQADLIAELMDKAGTRLL